LTFELNFPPFEHDVCDIHLPVTFFGKYPIYLPGIFWKTLIVTNFRLETVSLINKLDLF
jgi:hypothetical protein